MKPTDQDVINFLHDIAYGKTSFEGRDLYDRALERFHEFTGLKYDFCEVRYIDGKKHQYYQSGKIVIDGIEQ